ncbi:hypothetical protein SPACI_011850 [Sporomusa acidovorans DSM 3132]|uniref:Uncharacterized protein n=1 Tax=Sporomusa acidovorans (strain ATCC 49682 / DSM 3132 / Mol) TaxID=1123286 RepID=A0ABZ3IZE3_SPOA4|nr:hypothetical protein SPACI_38990 [Sporomusa acidovorans DSM 3132]SDF15725.1 hypothetical protein SAMN04488499_103532 [Sporomusa acidovorans]
MVELVGMLIVAWLLLSTVFFFRIDICRISEKV